jgi:hypothetical protein
MPVPILSIGTFWYAIFAIAKDIYGICCFTFICSVAQRTIFYIRRGGLQG